MKGYLGEEPLPSYEGTPYEGYTAVDWALEFIGTYGQIDGSHHKQWALDQAARVLLGTPVQLNLAKWENGHEAYRFVTGKPSQAYLDWVEKMKDGDTYDYNEGIAT